MKLYLAKTKNEVCSDLQEMRTFFQRAKGFIGVKSATDTALWFKQCNWIQTFFMSMPIDVVYLDKNMTIKKVDHSLVPWRIPMPVFSASSVIELPAGLAKAKQLQIGDQLHVGH